MPNKNIYVSESDLPLFEEAQELAKGNLSSVIVHALRQYVKLERIRQGGFEEITVKVNPDGLFTKKRFQGRLLTRMRFRVERDGTNRVVTYMVYLTSKGNWAVLVKDVPGWWYHPTEMKQWREQKREDWEEFGWGAEGWTDQEYTYRLDVYKTEEEMQAHIPEQVYSSVCRTMNGEGGDVEVLDI